MVDSKSEKKLKGILVSVLLVDQAEIHDKMSRKDLEIWDSMCHLVLITEIESAFGVKMSDADLSAIKNVGDIKRVLVKLGIDV